MTDESDGDVSLVASVFDWLHSGLDYAEALIVWSLGGFKLAKPETVGERLAECDGCENNRDSRCELCGCRIGERGFWTRWTSKIYFPRESCPADKWRAE